MYPTVAPLASVDDTRRSSESQAQVEVEVTAGEALVSSTMAVRAPLEA